MTMTQLGRPKGPVPTWATDENYEAGDEDWSATPTKVDLLDAERAVGATPDAQVNAQKWNAHHHSVGQHIAALADVGVRNWPHVGYIDLDYSDLTDTYGGCIATFRPREVGVSSGNVVAEEEELWVTVASLNYLISADHGVTWKPREDLPADVGDYFSSLHQAVGGTAGRIIIGGTMDSGAADTSILRSANSARTWSVTTVLAGTKYNCQALHYDRALGKHFYSGQVTGTNATRVFVSSDDGGTWVEHAISGWATARVECFASNGSVVVGAGNQDGEIVYSDDGGATWNVIDPGIEREAGWAGLAYSPEEEQFMLLADNFRLATSSNGVDWTVRRLTAIPIQEPNKGLLNNCRGLACVGATWVAVHNVWLEDAVMQGIIYSTDMGRNWEFVSLGGFPANAGQGFNRVVAARDHFMVSRPNGPELYCASLSIGSVAPKLSLY